VNVTTLMQQYDAKQLAQMLVELENELADWRARRDEKWQDYENMRADKYALEAELAAHLENEGDECPLCVVEAENQRLRDTNEMLASNLLAEAENAQRLEAENARLRQQVTNFQKILAASVGVWMKDTDC
jgi:hypothetical protein